MKDRTSNNTPFRSLCCLFLLLLGQVILTPGSAWSSAITYSNNRLRNSSTSRTQLCMVTHETIPATTALSMTFEQLSMYLGGKGRAQACWELYRLGVDPLWYYNSNNDQNEQEYNHDGLGTGWTRKQLQTTLKASTMGADAIQRLAQLFTCSTTTLTHVSRSTDKTTKLLLRLQDGLQVETVIIPSKDRCTLCISSQVGCRQGCVFCATGRMGILRSLTCDEILSQVVWANQACRLLEGLTEVDNVVFMGMGEPADNASEVVRAAHQLVDRNLFAVSAKRITISTVAPTPQAFYELAQAPVVLAWSVHASMDSVRKKLVPTTKYTMDELREGLLVALDGRSRSLKSTMLEIALLEGINDNEHNALHLAEFCQPLIAAVPKLVVNLIPWNNIGATSGWATEFKQPSLERILAFQQVLTKHGVLCRIRMTRGDEEGSACGQLATKVTKSKQSN